MPHRIVISNHDRVVDAVPSPMSSCSNIGTERRESSRHSLEMQVAIYSEKHQTDSQSLPREHIVPYPSRSLTRHEPYQARRRRQARSSALLQETCPLRAFHSVLLTFAAAPLRLPLCCSISLARKLQSVNTPLQEDRYPPFLLMVMSSDGKRELRLLPSR